VVEAYETAVPAASGKRLRAALAKRARRPHVITFTSSSTARNFITLLGRKKHLLAGTSLASIGPVTSATLRELGLNPTIEAKEYTMSGLVRAIVLCHREVRLQR
ncbi:MAG: uroporphyrinogen-III synthase, partial [Acidobacteriota bacterium]|nr:uroporphyrinogen-III synthase [Acidobacteriota bacterium]